MKDEEREKGNPFHEGWTHEKMRRSIFRLPQENVEWTKLPPDAVVELLRIGESQNRVYVAKLPSGDAVVNWESRQVREAQAFLDARVLDNG